MRRALLIAALLAPAVAAPAAAGAATSDPAVSARATTVDLMVVGKERVLHTAGEVRLAGHTVRVGGRRCAIHRSTPLAALLATRLTVRLRDFGSCGRSVRDSGQLYVSRIGREREGGRGGWVYKVGRRAGSAGAADPAGPFGNGRLRAGQRVLWFWCELGSTDGCQRTLEARPDRRRAAPGETLGVTVRGYDDNGRGVAVEGATVRLGAVEAVTGADGAATLTVPAQTGALQLTATRDGMVQAFPSEVRVG
jgi:hypothetical protein